MKNTKIIIKDANEIEETIPKDIVENILEILYDLFTEEVIKQWAKKDVKLNAAIVEAGDDGPEGFAIITDEKALKYRVSHYDMYLNPSIWTEVKN